MERSVKSLQTQCKHVTGIEEVINKRNNSAVGGGVGSLLKGLKGRSAAATSIKRLVKVRRLCTEGRVEGLMKIQEQKSRSGYGEMSVCSNGITGLESMQ